MKFDPVYLHETLSELIIPRARKKDVAEAFQLKLLYSYGTSVLDCCMQCFLVGRFDVGRELMPKARTFLRAAVEHKEEWENRPQGGAQFQRLCEFALCNWLLEKRHDSKSLKLAVEWQEIWFAEHDEIDKTNVQLSLSEYLNAEEYEVLIRRFEQGGLKKPSNLRQIKGEGTMSYVIARHRLGLEYSAEEVQAALKSFLKRNVATWLGHGHRDTTAVWMKLAFWKPGDDPVATLLKCYNYLPGLEPPKYP